MGSVGMKYECHINYDDCDDVCPVGVIWIETLRWRVVWMIENKRYSFNWERGHPNFWDNHCDLADCYLTCEDVVDRLNELSDENDQLKQQLKSIEDIFLN